MRFNILVTSVTGVGVQQQVLLGSMTLSQIQDFGAYQVAQPSCVTILESNTSREHSVMTSGRVKRKRDEDVILTIP